MSKSLRSKFSLKEIKNAVANNPTVVSAAKSLSELKGVKVSRQILQYWIVNEDIFGEYDPKQFSGNFNAQTLATLTNTQKANSKLRKDNKDLADFINSSKDVQEGFVKALKRLRYTPPVGLPSPRPLSVGGASNKVTVEVLLSDLQIGKLSPEYNTQVAKARLKKYTESIILAIDQKVYAGYEVDKIVLAILGDIIESDKKHLDSGRATDTGTAEQMADAIEGMYTYVIEPLARLGYPVDVVCVTGNHDHDGRGMMMFKAGVNHLSYPIYKGLEVICKTAGLNDVKFIIPEGCFAVYEIYGQNILYEHGVGISVNENSMKLRKTQRSEQLGNYITYMRMGDKHNLSSFNACQYVVNGSFFGTDNQGAEYSSASGYSSVAAQWVGFHCPKSSSRELTMFDSFAVQLGGTD